MKKIYLKITVTLLLSIHCFGKTVYVSSNGSDHNTGTFQAPVKSLKKALGLHDGKNSLRVLIKDKKFIQLEQIEINSLDFPVNMQLSIEGMSADNLVVINGFRGVGRNRLKKINSSKDIYLVPRIKQMPGFLTIQGEYFSLPARRNVTEFKDIEISPETGEFTFNGININGKFKTYANGVNEWRYFECPIKEYNGVKGSTRFSLDDSCLGIDFFNGNLPSFTYVRSVANHPLFIQNNGDWACSHLQKSIFINLKKSEYILVPKKLHSSLFKVVGHAHRPFKNISFRNILFKGYDLINEKAYAALQAGTYKVSGKARNPNAIIELDKFVNSGSIVNCTFLTNNAVGVKLNRAIKNVSIFNNTFKYLSSSAIIFGSWAKANNDKLKTEFIRIRDNYIYKSGQRFLDSAAITGLTVENSIVNFNTIKKTPYTAISMGWGWTFENRNGLGGNQIQWNKLSENMLELNDGAAIYSVSAYPEDNKGHITHNFISMLGGGYKAKLPTGKSLSPPIYLDFGSRHMSVHSNIVSSTSFDKKAHVSTKQFIFGPFFKQAGNPKGEASPCGYKACDIDVRSNRFFNTKSKNDHSIRNLSGSRFHK